jgi:alkylation response protein AidB-like acyl-CoA dehydrogenase
VTTVDSSLSATSVVERASTIASTLPDRAPEIEAARRVPPDLLQDLIGAGCFRMLLPPTHGGAGAPLPAAIELFETLARGDASTAWIVMIASGAWIDLAGLPRATFDALFPPSADVIVAGVFAPSGTISPMGDDFELTGRWAFASGCEHATFLYANAIESFADGHPMMRASILMPDEVTIEDTWRVVGLRGTGSHHFSVVGATVPRERTFVPLSDAPCVDAPLLRIPIPAVIAVAIAAVALGTARGALDDVVDLAEGKVPLLAPGVLATSAPFQRDLARADAQLGAAKAHLGAVATQLWETAVAEADASLHDRARARAAAAAATETARNVTTFAFRAAGGTAVYDDSPLQRRLRDAHAIGQHFLVRSESFVHAGEVLAGQELTAPVF